MEKTCHFEGFRNYYSVSYLCLLLLTLLPFGTWFGWFFWKQLKALPQESTVSSMTRLSLKVYIAATTCSLWLTAVIHLLFPVLDALGWHRLVLCALVTCASNLALGIAYVAFQRILLERLKVTFENTTHAVGFRVATAFDAVQLCMALGIVLVAYVWTAPCMLTSHFYEMPGTEQHFFCRVQYKSVAFSVIAAFALAIVGGNVCIALNYVWRMKAVFLDANLRVADELYNDNQISIHASKNVVLAMDLMRKSTVITIWSVGSTLLAMAAFKMSFQSMAPKIDLVLNEVLIYCLFPVGDDLYDTLLGFCHFTVDCYLPQRTLDIELVYTDEMTQPRAGQSLDGRSAAVKRDESSSVS